MISKLNKIKIIHILPSFKFGGAERLTVDLLKNLEHSKFEAKIIFIKPAAKNIWEDELKKNNIPIIKLNKKSKIDIKIFFALVKILKKEKSDIVHTHLFLGHIFGILAAKLARVKCIVSTEHNLNYSEKFYHRLLRKITAKLTNVTIAVSEAVKYYTISYEGIKKDNIIVINNGVETERFLNRKRRYNKQDLVIGSIGRLSKQKGFDFLINAIKRINNDKITCCIAGEGEFMNNLQKQIELLNLQAKVKLIGRVNDVTGFLKKIDIFILPSRWEGFGIVILEAGLSGLPVIASRIDGIKEIIDDNDNGLLVNVGDEDQLAQKINDLIKNSKKREILGINLQNKIIKKFNIKAITKQYEKIYISIFNKFKKN